MKTKIQLTRAPLRDPNMRIPLVKVPKGEKGDPGADGADGIGVTLTATQIAFGSDEDAITGSPKLLWIDEFSLMYLGEPGSGVAIKGAPAESGSDIQGCDLELGGGDGDGAGPGASGRLFGGNGGETGNGGGAGIGGGSAGSTSGNGGAASVSGGTADNGNGGDVILTPGSTSGGGVDGLVKINGGLLRLQSYLVANLPAPSAARAGCVAFVTNATQAMTAGIGAVVAGGGSNAVPVFCDGSVWRIG